MFAIVFLAPLFVAAVVSAFYVVAAVVLVDVCRIYWKELTRPLP